MNLFCWEKESNMSDNLYTATTIGGMLVIGVMALVIFITSL